MSKNLTVKISVDEPTVSYERDTQWSRLESLAGKCPIPHFSSGYCFNQLGDQVYGRPYREYSYQVEKQNDAEEIRIYWTSKEIDVGIDQEDIEINIWDSDEEWPILENDKIETKDNIDA